MLPHQCNVCGVMKEDNEFYGKRNTCKSCQSIKNRNTIKPRLVIGKERLLKAVQDRGMCIDCKRAVTETTRAMFHWDHRIPADKTRLIGQMLASCDETFYDELAKCDLVCIICHAERTAKQRDERAICVGRPRKYDSI